MLIAQTGGVYSVTRFITVLILFIFVLGITYWTSRYVAGFQKKRMGSANIEVVEAARLSQNVVLEIVRAGDQYLLISVGKDGARLITKLDPETLTLQEGAALPGGQEFQDFLKKVAANLPRKHKSPTKPEDDDA